MKRFRLSTLILLVVISALALAMVLQHDRAIRRELTLRDGLRESLASEIRMREIELSNVLAVKKEAAFDPGVLAKKGKLIEIRRKYNLNLDDQLKLKYKKTINIVVRNQTNLDMGELGNGLARSDKQGRCNDEEVRQAVFSAEPRKFSLLVGPAQPARHVVSEPGLSILRSV